MVISEHIKIHHASTWEILRIANERRMPQSSWCRMKCIGSSNTVPDLLLSYTVKESKHGYHSEWEELSLPLREKEVVI